MKKKILSLAILVSVLIMSIPQTVYAEFSCYASPAEVYIGETYTGTDIFLASSCTGDIQNVDNSKLPKGLSVKIDGRMAYLTGTVSEGNNIGDGYSVELTDKSENQDINISVKKGSYSITGVSDSMNKKLGDGSFKLEPVAKDMSNADISGGTYSYTSSKPNVATVASDGTVTLVGTGKTVICVKFEKDGKYESLEDIVLLTVTDDSSPSTSDSDQNQNTDNDNQSSNSTDNNNQSSESSSKSETVEAPNPFVVYLQSQTSKIKNAKAGDTVIIESNSDLSLPLWFMKELQARKDITIKLSYNYKGLHYEITIPKGQTFVLDDTIPWYGPLKLSAMFGADITPVK